jgi:hypothetical protein
LEVALEDFDGDGAFLEFVGAAFEGAGDDEVEEIGAALAAAEGGTGEDAAEFVFHAGADFRGGYRSRNRRFGKGAHGRETVLKISQATKALQGKGLGEGVTG